MQKCMAVDTSKFNLETAVAGGPIKIEKEIIWGLNSCIISHLNGSDLLVHIQYFPKENRYGFSIYKEEK